jgi:hypothetical protein
MAISENEEGGRGSVGEMLDFVCLISPFVFVFFFLFRSTESLTTANENKRKKKLKRKKVEIKLNTLAWTDHRSIGSAAATAI